MTGQQPRSDGGKLARMQKVLRVASFTRKHDRQAHPLLYKLGKKLSRRVCPRGARAASLRLVVQYDEGLISINTRLGAGRRILFWGCHEPEIVRLIKAVVKSGSTCLDIGANIGAHTLVMAHRAGPQGKVVAVEPEPETARRLRENIALNRLRNVLVIEAALTDGDGSVPFYVDEDPGRSCLRPTHRARCATSVRSPARHWSERLSSRPVTS